VSGVGPAVVRGKFRSMPVPRHAFVRADRRRHETLSGLVGFVADDTGRLGRDVVVKGWDDRNGAIDGDIVYVLLLGPVAKKEGEARKEEKRDAEKEEKKEEEGGGAKDATPATDGADAERQARLWGATVRLPRDATKTAAGSARGGRAGGSGDAATRGPQLEGRVLHVLPDRGPLGTKAESRCVVGQILRDPHGPICLVPDDAKLPPFLVYGAVPSVPEKDRVRSSDTGKTGAPKNRAGRHTPLPTEPHLYGASYMPPWSFRPSKWASAPSSQGRILLPTVSNVVVRRSIFFSSL